MKKEVVKESRNNHKTKTKNEGHEKKKDIDVPSIALDEATIKVCL